MLESAYFLQRIFMRIFMIFLAFYAFAFAQDNERQDNERKDFLTQFEYGRALYKNPRGIGCIQCHGTNGEGGVISSITQNGKTKYITAPKIRGVNFIKFENALKNPKGLMPSYNLTPSELLALYIFLNPNFKLPK